MPLRRIQNILPGCVVTSTVASAALVALLSLKACGDEAPSGPVNQAPSILTVTAPFFVPVPDSGSAGDDTIYVSALDPDGDAITISLDVRAADGSAVGDALPEQMNDDGSGPDKTTGDNMFAAILKESVINETGGRYTITFSIRDDRGNEGSAFVHEILSGKNFPPEVFNPVFPDTVVIPQSGATPFDISIQANDPNGLFDVKQVLVIFNNPGGTQFQLPMKDDGDVLNSGDQVASDGVFTLRIVVAAGNPPGPRPLEFFAIDFGGLQGESLLDTLVLVDSN